MFDIRLIFSLAILGLLSLAVFSIPSFGYPIGSINYYGAEYVKNYDGDTITFNLPNWPDIVGKKISVRVFGIDTPEIRGSKCSQEKMLAYKAKKAVELMFVSAKMISILNIKRGKYFRLVGDVIVDGVSVADVLMRRGLAVPYFGKKKLKSWC